MANKINHLLTAYQQLRQQNDDWVLATIIETLGSTYQKPGARMLINQQGELNGLLGGGCFERDLVEQAQSVFASGECKTVFYDMRAPEDIVWGLGLGCNGAVRVLLQRLSATDGFSPLNILAETAEQQLSGMLVTIYASTHADFPVGHSVFLPNPAAHPHLAASAEPLATATYSHQSRLETLTISGLTVKAFYDSLQPPWQLLIIGAGADSLPLLASAKALGWRVTVIDYRPAHIRPERFPNADQLHLLRAEELADNLSLSNYQAAVIMTHNVDNDARYLKALATTRIPFMGLLGPSHRKERLLHSLGDDAERLAGRVFGPVGLDIGAETPEEIALSIMAGIHAQLNGRNGRQLGHKTAGVGEV